MTDHRQFGLLSGDPRELARRVTRAWELFIAAAEQAQPEGATRSARRNAREVMIPLGSWDDSRGIAGLRADALAGTTSTEPYKAAGDRLLRSHGNEPHDAVLASLRRSADQARRWVESADLEATGPLPTPSPLGLIPMAAAVHAAAFQLAATARDLMPAGAPEVPELDQIGLVALLDATGAVGARIQLSARASAVGARTAVACTIDGGGWTTTLGDEPDYPAVLGPEEVLVDLAAGRIAFGALAKQLRFRDGKGLLPLSAVVDEIPDLPAGPLLRKAAQLARFFGR